MFAHFNLKGSKTASIALRTLSLNMKFICTRCETGLKISLFCLFLKLVQINFIFTDNVRILYMSTIFSKFHLVLNE
jgi:hypothetical protein